MPGRDFMPGVPAAGHVTAGGFWHPGGAGSCHKPPCGELPVTDLAVGDGVVYRPHPGAVAEDGVVTGFSADRSLVFVRYADQHPGAPGKATPIRMLTRTSGARVRRGAD